MILTAALAGAVAWPAAAADLIRTTDGYSYFYKAGADRAAHDRDVTECRWVASRLHQPVSQGPTSIYVPAGTSPVAAGIGGGLGAAIGMAIVQKMADSKGNPVNLENCMVVKGWQVAVVDEAEGKALAADPKALQAQLSQWVGAPAPHGAVARSFNNDVSAVGTSIWSMAIKKGDSLSAAAVDGPKPERPTAAQPIAYLPQPKRAAPLPKMAKTARPPKPLADADLGGVPADSGLVAVNVDGDSEITVTLERLGADNLTPAWVDGRPDTIYVARPATTFAKTGQAAGATYVYALPPGRWRLASVSVNGTQLSLCLGGPAFDLKAGEVAYAGSFRSNQVAPNMDLAPAKAAFPPLSPLGEQVKPVSWVNGVQGQCSGAYAYVLELP
ncbi:MAG TPA: hypothetical protein VF495_17715, partial [Phenylobacterium sp.]